MASAVPPPLPPSPSQAAPCPPGETVLEALRAALQADQTIRTPAENALQSWEASSGYVPLLLDVLLSDQVEVPVRVMAATQAGQVVKRLWRPRPNASVSPVDKANVRSRLGHLIGVPNKQLVRVCCDLVAKIARFDWPSDQWPELLPCITQSMQGEDPVARESALAMLHAVVGELASCCLPREKAAFQNASPHVFGFVLPVLLQVLPSAHSQDSNAAFALKLVKVIKPLCTRGLKRFDTPEFQAFVDAACVELPQLLQIAKLPQSGSGESALIRIKLAKTLIRTLSAALHSSPITFLPKLGKCSATLLPVLSEWRTLNSSQALPNDEDLASTLDKAVSAAAMLFKNALFQSAYSATSVRNALKRCKESNIPDEQQIIAAVQCVFTQETLSQLVNECVGGLLLLTQGDLLEWQEDPDNFHNSQQIDYTGKPAIAGEQLLLAVTMRDVACACSVINHHMQQTLAPLARTLQQGVDGQASLGLPDILRMDAVLHSLGTVVFECKDGIDLRQIIDGMLVPALLSGSMNMVLKRRVSWLLGECVDALSLPSRAHHIHALCKALCDDNVSVCLSAASSLHAIANSAEFLVSDMEPYLLQITSRSCELFNGCRDVDSRLLILNLLAVTNEAMGTKAASVASQLAALLPSLWSGAGDEAILKGPLVKLAACVTAAVQGQLQPDSLQSLFSIASYACDPSGPDALYVLDTGIDLVKVLVRNLTQYTQPLHELYARILEVMTQTWEHVTPCFRITESYMLLGGQNFWGSYGPSLSALIAQAYDDLSDTGIVLVSESLCFILTAFPQAASQLTQAFTKITALVLSSAANERGPLVVTALVSVLARWGAAAPSDLLAFLQAGGGAAAVQGFSKSMSDHLDSVPSLRGKKVFAACALGLISTGNHGSLSCLDGLLALVVDVKCSIDLGREGGTSSLEEIMLKVAGVYEEQQSAQQDGENAQLPPDVQRRTAMLQNDSLRNLDVSASLQQAISGCIASCGHEAWVHAWQAVDADTRTSISSMCPGLQ